MKDLKVDESIGLVLEGGGMRVMGCRMLPVNGDVPNTAILTCWKNTTISV